MKILLIAGHGAGDPGAAAAVNGTEYKEAGQTRIAAALLEKELGGLGAETAVYDTARNAYADSRLGVLGSRAEFEKYDYVLELHFNAFRPDSGDGKTKGAEIYWPSTGPRSGMEERILTAAAGCGLTKRSAKAGRFAVIQAAWKAGVRANLLEICFLDDADDMAVWEERKSEICRAIAEAITKEEDEDVKLERFAMRYTDIEHMAYIPMAGGSGETVSAAALRRTWGGRAPDVICNAELFDMKTYAPASGVVSGGEAQLPAAAHGAALAGGKKPVLSWQNNVKASDWIGAYPVLLRDGKLAFTAVPAGLGGKRARTALAWNGTGCAVFFARAGGGCTLAELARAIAKAGYETAINFDGGASTAVVTPETVYEQGRRVRGKLGIWLRGGSGNILARKAGGQSSQGSGRVTAMQRDAGAAGGKKLTVTARSGLKIRAAAIDGAALEVVGRGQTVSWYGYYCAETASGAKWYYVKTAAGKCGYAAAAYLKG